MGCESLGGGVDMDCDAGYENWKAPIPAVGRDDRGPGTFRHVGSGENDVLGGPWAVQMQLEIPRSTCLLSPPARPRKEGSRSKQLLRVEDRFLAVRCTGGPSCQAGGRGGTRSFGCGVQKPPATKTSSKQKPADSKRLEEGLHVPCGSAGLSPSLTLHRARSTPRGGMEVYRARDSARNRPAKRETEATGYELAGIYSITGTEVWHNSCGVSRGVTPSLHRCVSHGIQAGGGSFDHKQFRSFTADLQQTVRLVLTEAPQAQLAGLRDGFGRTFRTAGSHGTRWTASGAASGAAVGSHSVGLVFGQDALLL